MSEWKKEVAELLDAVAWAVFCIFIILATAAALLEPLGFYPSVGVGFLIALAITLVRTRWLE